MTGLITSSNLKLLPNSIVSWGDVEYSLAQFPMGARIAVLAPGDSPVLDNFEGEISEFKERRLLIGALNPRNASSLREQLPWLCPKVLGTKTSIGMGDRLGIATPGHVRAMRDTRGRIAPVFAQQSIREMVRTGRSPQQVMDEAMWGIFEEGWQDGFGADADHLKTLEDIDRCWEAGYTFYTFDPGDYVDNRAETYSLTQLDEKASRVPAHINARASELQGKVFDLGEYQVELTEPVLLKAVVKYGKAIAHTASMYNHLQQLAKYRAFEVEISMDETELPTSAAEHIYIASELERLGVTYVSFAPRFVGSFEKGVDYIGDVEIFGEELSIHAAIARQLGPYKLSMHSGSDKFSLYSIFMEKTKGQLHLKTAGTSYLEALGTIAEVDETLMKEIYSLALRRFETDKQSYHISAQVSKAPAPEKVHDWRGLLEQFEAREILHVTFGSVLNEKSGTGERILYRRIMFSLQTNRELYFHKLQKHFKRHLQPFLTTEGKN